MRTPVIRKEDVDRPDVPEAQRRWFVIDAAGRPLGRTASRVAMILRGKNKPTFTPHVDMGDFVVVINAEKVGLTGRKLDQKMYYHHSNWPGGFREENAKHLLQRKPTELMTEAVKGMLPKGPLGRKLLKKLKVYAGSEHPHQAQKPQTISE
jgi:large subunit ribosomal protein L13